jgi:hypothetical protein
MSGGGRNRDQPQDVGEQRFWNGDFGHLKRDIATWLMTFAPILMSFSFRLVSDHSSHGEVQVKG